MKLHLKYQDPNKAFEIAERMIDTVSAVSATDANLSNLEPQIMENIVEIVKQSIQNTLKIIVDDSSELVVSYDLEGGISNTFETVCKLVKQSMMLNE